MIYNQGQPCNKVYLIKSGEFEQYFDVKALEDGKVKTHTYTGPTRQNVKQLQKSLKVERQKTMFVSHAALLNKGMMMGDEDALEMKSYSKSVRCISQRGYVYVVNSADFLHLTKIFQST